MSLPIEERFVQSGAKDTNLVTSGSLPPNAAPLTLTLDVNMKSAEPLYIEILAQSAAVIAAAYSFSGNLKFHNPDGTVVQEIAIAAAPTLINTKVAVQQRFPIPSSGITKAVYIATYVSGVDPAGVDVSIAMVQA